MKLTKAAAASNKKMSHLVTQLPRTHRLIVIDWSSRELERQNKTASLERTMLQAPRVSPLARLLRPEVEMVCKDDVVKFLKRTPEDIRADQLAVQAEAPGLLEEIIGTQEVTT